MDKIMDKCKEIFAKMDKDALKKMGIVTAIFAVIVILGCVLSQSVAKEVAEKEAAEAAAAEAATTEALGGEVTRITGNNTAAASVASATTYMAVAGVDSLDNVIIVSDQGFADALSGTYLSKVNGAPILVIPSKEDGSVDNIGVATIASFLKESLADEGTITLLGGTSVISADVEASLGSCGNVTRIAAADRYATNLAVLQAAGLADDVTTLLVASGAGFADSISAASTGLPMLLVGDTLTAEQQKYLEENNFDNIYVLGSTTAVPAAVETALAKYGEVERISGDSRYETSAAIAEKFFEETNAVAITTGQDFTAGLSGALLANQMNAPLLLVDDNATTAAKSYTSGKEIKYVLNFATAEQVADATMNAIK